MNQKKNIVGILTFHCSDNYGAMLQTFGLKQYLKKKGIEADIVRYEPPFLTGRDWWIPYVPVKQRGQLLYLGCLWITHIMMGMDFFRMKKNMSQFRNKYLIQKKKRKLWFARQLRTLSYRYYIVGSDQIWNPNITCGLRNVYFGAFHNKRKEKVISYAASLGGSVLSPEYDRQFSELLKHVDAVSVREEAAVPYVKKLYQGEVKAVVDPVFFLEEKNWRKIEKPPKYRRFILVYTTEKNEELFEFAGKLSLETGIPVIELRTRAGRRNKGFFVEYTAGPAEFLGYIHHAEYVVTSSFHAVAFSIIFEKTFFAFLHSTAGERVENILRICGLESRIYRNDKDYEPEMQVDWKKAKEKINEKVRLSEEFLMKNIGKENSLSLQEFV